MRFIRMLPGLVPILMVSQVGAQAPPTARGDSLLAAGNLEAAAAAYRAVVAADSTIGLAWYRLGQTLRQSGRYAEAIEALHHNLALGGPAIVRFEVARNHARLHRPDSTTNWMQQAVQGGYGSVAQIDSLAQMAGIAESEALSGLRTAADRVARPCEYDPNFRQFDFWEGEWEVSSATGVPQGTNVIRRMSNGCMLYESWTNVGGVTGHSMNYYDGGLGKFVQVWVGAAGGVIHVQGNADSTGAMVLEGEIRGATGTRSPFRARWSVLDDGRVRQLMEISADSGRTWSVWFDGYYRSKAARDSGPGGRDDGR